MRNTRFRLNKRIEREVEKMNKMQKITNGDKAKGVTTKEYIAFILREETKPEKADVLKCIEGQLLIEDGKVCVKREA